MVHVCGPGRAHQAHELDSNLRMMDSSKISPHVAEHLDSVQHAMQDRIDDLKQQIRETDDPVEKLALENEIMNLEEVFDGFVRDMMEFSAEFSDFMKGFDDDVVIEFGNRALRDKVADLRNLIADSYQQFGTAEMPAQSFCGTMATNQPVDCGGDFEYVVMEFPPPIVEDLKMIVPEASSGEVDSSGKAEGAGQTEGAEGSGEAGETEFNVSELVELFNDDPTAFYDKLSSMTSQDRNTAMMLVQNEMQQINQMFSMISNLAKSMHDTSKAMINNMRV